MRATARRRLAVLFAGLVLVEASRADGAASVVPGAKEVLSCTLNGLAGSWSTAVSAASVRARGPRSGISQNRATPFRNRRRAVGRCGDRHAPSTRRVDQRRVGPRGRRSVWRARNQAWLEPGGAPRATSVRSGLCGLRPGLPGLLRAGNRGLRGHGRPLGRAPRARHGARGRRRFGVFPRARQDAHRGAAVGRRGQGGSIAAELVHGHAGRGRLVRGLPGAREHRAARATGRGNACSTWGSAWCATSNSRRRFQTGSVRSARKPSWIGGLAPSHRDFASNATTARRKALLRVECHPIRSLCCPVVESLSF